MYKKILRFPCPAEQRKYKPNIHHTCKITLFDPMVCQWNTAWLGEEETDISHSHNTFQSSMHVCGRAQLFPFPL